MQTVLIGPLKRRLSTLDSALGEFARCAPSGVWGGPRPFLCNSQNECPKGRRIFHPVKAVVVV
jgi:hypothetical protein